MVIQVFVEIVYFVALIYMFCYVEVLPFSSKKIQYIVMGGTGAMVAVNLLLLFFLPGTALGQMALFTQTLPSMLICWIASRHKDMRFLFVFCSLDVTAFMLLLIVNGVAAIFDLSDNEASVLNILILLPFIFIFHKFGVVFRELTEKVQKNWGRLAFFVLLFYAYSYFLILYPTPWKKRPEYAPVLIGFAAVILYCFYIIIWMLVDMNKIQEMEQKGYEMKLKIEKQSRELEEKKSHILIHKINPHFIYNVLMSIRYFIKKDPQAAYDMVYDFSSYLRSNVEQLENVNYIFWSEELKHIDTYVRIEKMRFKDRLNIVYDIGEEDFQIPPLSVEPLVENAVKHGVTQKISGGTVWIRSRATETGYEILIEDDGVGFDVKGMGKEKSVGLDYIRARLDMMEGAGMQIESTPGQGTRIRLTFARRTGGQAGCR